MEEHKYYSGRYLITAIRHRITDTEYTMHIEASKDSYLSAPSTGFDLQVPEVQTPDGKSGQNVTAGGGLGGGNDSFR